MYRHPKGHAGYDSEKEVVDKLGAIPVDDLYELLLDLVNNCGPAEEVHVAQCHWDLVKQNLGRTHNVNVNYYDNERKAILHHLDLHNRRCECLKAMYLVPEQEDDRSWFSTDLFHDEKFLDLYSMACQMGAIEHDMRRLRRFSDKDYKDFIWGDTTVVYGFIVSFAMALMGKMALQPNRYCHNFGDDGEGWEFLDVVDNIVTNNFSWMSAAMQGTINAHYGDDSLW